jgi:hypothetical protein
MPYLLESWAASDDMKTTFSWGTLLDFAYSVAVHRDYYGHV